MPDTQGQDLIAFVSLALALLAIALTASSMIRYHRAEQMLQEANEKLRLAREICARGNTKP